MNLTSVDWLIVAGLMVVVVGMAAYTKRYTRSVADFLAANRCAGRYMLAIAEGEAALGAISLIAMFQLYQKAGFTAIWWYFMSLPIGITINLTGYIIYRYRQTRVLTMAEFFEKRYSRRFRVFMGILMFVTGVVNFGIFPAVGAKFFINFCGLPESVALWGLAIPTFHMVMTVLLGAALCFTFAGGQIAVMVTDFIQGMFTNVVVILVLIFIFSKVDWGQITEVLLTAPPNESKVNPFETTKTKDFGFWFFMMNTGLALYRHKAWQGAQGYNCAALTPHEAKMGTILGSLRGMSQNLMIVMVAIVGVTLLHHQDFAPIAEKANAALSVIENEEVRDQMRVPLAMSGFLHPGLVGAFCAVFLAAFISTNDTYLHSWGSIFIQDVVMPFRKKPLSSRQHMLILRWAIIGVAVFIYVFSTFFQQKQAILLWMNLSAAIYLGGAGAVIVGGLYWRGGTTLGAYAGTIVGIAVAGVGIVIRQINEDFFLNGMHFAFLSSVMACGAYVLLSVLDRRPSFNMDKLLHRGAYAVDDDVIVQDKGIHEILRRLGITGEFSRGDRIIYCFMVGWTIFWFGTFVVGTVIHLTVGSSDAAWCRFWQYYIWVTLIMGVPITIWLAIGGLVDMRRMFQRLRQVQRDSQDDGWVAENE